MPAAAKCQDGDCVTGGIGFLPVEIVEWMLQSTMLVDACTTSFPTPAEGCNLDENELSNELEERIGRWWTGEVNITTLAALKYLASSCLIHVLSRQSFCFLFLSLHLSIMSVSLNRLPSVVDVGDG